MRISVDLSALADHFTGIERYARDLTLAMLEADPENEYELYFKGEPDQAFSAFSERKNVHFHVLPDTRKLWFYQVALPQAMEKCPSDAYLFPAFPVPYAFRQREAFGLIADLGCFDCPETMKQRMALYFRLSFKRMAARGDRIITVSEFSKDRIMKQLKVPEKQILLLPCGLSPSFREVKDDPGQLRGVREKYGLPGHFCLSLSTLEPRKNLAMLLKEYTALLQDGVLEYPLVLAGRTGWLSRELLIEIACSDGVYCPGFIEEEDLAALYRMSDCFIFPSVYEGFGLPPLEALSQGVPVISSDAGALKEVLGTHAAYFKRDDPEDLRRVLSGLPAMLSERTAAQREEDIRYSRSFSAEDSAALLLSELRNIEPGDTPQEPETEALAGNRFAFHTGLKTAIKNHLPAGVIWELRTLRVKRTLQGYKKRFRNEAYQALPAGVNLIGDIRAEIGLGQSMRLLAASLRDAELPFTVCQTDMRGNVRHGDHSFDDMIGESYPYRVNIFHINPESFADAYPRLPADMFEDRYNIAFWSWELQALPKDRLPLLKVFDEFWMPSEFAAEAIRKHTDKPVFAMPYHVTAETDPRYDRAWFGLPEQSLLYLVMYDANSTASRKNPEGAIEAYKKAFPEEKKDAGLVIKMNNPDEAEREKILDLLSGYRNVYLLDETLTKVQVNSLIRACDVFISLHRAEGFGLVLAEAMLNGTVCAATDWSANTEFMDERTSAPVSYTMIPVGGDHRIYPAGSFWADADTDDAAKKLLRLYEDPAYRKMLAENAEKDAELKLGKTAAAERIRGRLADIFDDRQEAGE